MTDEEGSVSPAKKEREKGAIVALMFISVISAIVIGASVMIGSVYSILFSPDAAVEWQYIAVMTAITLFVIVSEVTCHLYHRRIMFLLYLITALFMGVFFYMFLATSLAGSVLLLGLATGWNSNQLLMDLLRVLLTAGVVIPVVWGLIEGRVLRTRKIELDPGKKDGQSIRIALISDVHIGLLVGKGRLKRITRKVRKSEPDIIISAGDLLDTNPRFLSHLEPYLKELTSIAPSYAVIGNHEFYHGPNDSKQFLEKCGFEVLDNRSEEHRGPDLTIIGVDDPACFGSHEQYEEVMEKLVTASDKGSPLILVNHQPLNFRRAAELGVDLMLSGHTHSGQVFPAGFFTRMIYREGDRGLHQQGDSHMYVCYGSATWGPPMRVGGPAEIALIEF